jgi:hypothetical protein
MARKKKDEQQDISPETANVIIGETAPNGIASGDGNCAVGAPTPNKNLSIQRIGYKDGYVTIEAEENVPETDYVKNISLRSAEAPDPEFVAAFEALADGARQLIAVPANWAKDAIHVTKVSLGGKGVDKGATITCKASLDTSDTPFNFSTPFLPFSVEGDTNRPIMPPEICALIRKTEALSLDYLQGKRSQGSLPL